MPFHRAAKSPNSIFLASLSLVSLISCKYCSFAFFASSSRDSSESDCSSDSYSLSLSFASWFGTDPAAPPEFSSDELPVVSPPAPATPLPVPVAGLEPPAPSMLSFFFFFLRSFRSFFFLSFYETPTCPTAKSLTRVTPCMRLFVTPTLVTSSTFCFAFKNFYFRMLGIWLMNTFLQCPS